MKLCILAGNGKQAREYARSAGLGLNEYAIIHERTQMMGLGRGQSFVRVGTWWKHEGIEGIEQEIKIREWVEK